MANPITFSLKFAGAALLLSACAEPFDLDMRSMANGFDTSSALTGAPQAPVPDSNGVISYPTHKAALSRAGETPRNLGRRLGIDGVQLARTNGFDPDAPLKAGELLTLPTGSYGGAATGLPSGTQPLIHTVQTGETAYSIARLYDVPVQSLARLNNLGEQLTVRKGQRLSVPVVGSTTPAAPAVTISAPGQGSMTPIPPSSTTPLPKSNPEPLAPTASVAAPQVAPKLTTTETTSASSRMSMPMNGPIVRDYAKGRNDGIDIGGTPGTAVKAAAAGTVAAVTQNTDGAKIAVVKHSDGLLSVYLNVDDVSVAQGASVSRGQTLGKLASGHTALHFEVRNGLESVNPSQYLP